MCNLLNQLCAKSDSWVIDQLCYLLCWKIGLRFFFTSLTKFIKTTFCKPKLNKKRIKYISIPFKPPNNVSFWGGWGCDFTGCLALLAYMVIPGSQYSVFIVISYHCCCNVSVLLTDLTVINIVQKYNAPYSLMSTWELLFSLVCKPASCWI